VSILPTPQRPNEVKARECIRKNTQAHWLSSKASNPQAPPRGDNEPPPVEPKAGRMPYACRTNIQVKVASDLQADSYSAELATLFDTKRQMSAIVTETAISRGLEYMTVPEVEVILDDGRRKLFNKLFFLKVRPYRYRTGHPVRAPEPLLLAAYGVTKAAPAAVAAPELPLLTWRFRTRLNLAMGDLALRARPTELVIRRDNRGYWPMVSNHSQYTGDDLYLMKIQFHPRQLL
jgi:hypothetical protein